MFFVALNQATFAAQTYFKWDPNKTGTGSDGSGNWDATSTLWTSGSTDVKWANTVNSTNVASFGNGGGAAGTVTLQTAIWSDGISFSSASSGDYTIAAAGPSDTLTLGDSVTVPVGASPTISAPIVGLTNLMLCGGGTLNVSGANTYTGATVIYSGTLNVLPGATLGAGSSAVILGPDDRTGFGNLSISSSLSVGFLGTEASSTTPNTVNIPSSQTLTVSGQVDVLPGASGFLTVTGGGNLSVVSSIFVEGTNAVMDLSGLNSFNTSGPINIVGGGSLAQVAPHWRAPI